MTQPCVNCVGVCTQCGLQQLQGVLLGTKQHLSSSLLLWPQPAVLKGKLTHQQIVVLE
jgi:hypothetical protein